MLPNSIISKLKKAKSQKECLKQAYEFLTSRYHGERLATYTRIYQLFYPTSVFWKRRGFIHCTTANNLLTILLVESGHFKKSDIRKKWTTIWIISPHQYLQVKVGKKWIDIDLWGKRFGDHSYGFH